MAESLTLARPYARAAFEFALQRDRLDDWSGKLALLAGFLENDELRSVCRDPSQTAEQRARLLAELTGDSTDAELGNFLQLLSRNGRLELIPEIQELFEHQRAEHNQAIQVLATAAYPLTEQQSQALAARLESRLKRKVNMETAVDASLIGGVLVRAGDQVIDATVRGRLGRLAESLLS